VAGTVAHAGDGTVTAQAAIASTIAEGTAEASATGTTTSGYKRRVRGEHAPDTAVRTARSGGTKRDGGKSAEAMRSALSTMQTGMVRSMTEGDEPTDQGAPEE
jgi:hypothetical protein